MTEDEKKIQRWRNENVNKKGFKSQQQYDDSCTYLRHLRQDGIQWSLQMIEFDLIQHGWGPQRAKALALDIKHA